MPFDGTDFPKRQRRTPAKPSENVVCFVVLFAAMMLLFLPVSIDGFADIVRYFQRH